MDNIQQLTEALKPLADKIGQGAKIEWAAYYRQTYINAWTTIIFFGLLLIATIVLGSMFSHYNSSILKDDKKWQKSFYSDKESVNAGKWAIRAITTVLSLMWLGIIITGGIQPLLNPVFQTTHDIIGQFKPNSN